MHFSISFFWFWFRCWWWVCYLDVYSCTLSIYSIIFKVVTASCLTYTLGSNFWSSKACHIRYVNQSNVNQNFTESKVGPSRSSSCTIFNNFFRRQQDWNIWKCFCWLRWFAGLKTRMIPRKIYKKSQCHITHNQFYKLYFVNRYLQHVFHCHNIFQRKSSRFCTLVERNST